MIRPVRVCPLLALSVSAASLCAQPVIAATGTDEAPPITTSFQAFWSAAQGKPFAQQEALWDSYTEGPRAPLYRAVVWEVRDNPQWQANREEMLKLRFAQYPRVASLIPAEAAQIEAQRQTRAALLAMAH